MAQAVYASGSPYVLTETPALAAFGTQSPQLTLVRRVFHTLSARAVIDLSGCTIVSPIDITLKLRRTSGTPADIASCTTTLRVGIVGTSGTGVQDMEITIPQKSHRPSLANEVVQLWASVSALPASGEIRISEASVFWG